MQHSKITDYQQAAFHGGCIVGHTVKAVCALARTKGGRIAFVVIIGVILLLCAGCNHTPRPVTAPPVSSAPVIASQEGKDTAILSEAAQIDAIAPDAKPHTDAQRAAVAAAPAADVAKLSKEYEAAIAGLNKTIDGLKDTVAKQTKEIADIKDAEQIKQVSTLRWIGLGALAVAGLLAWAQQVRFAAVSALVGIVSLGLAQLISQPWFMPAVGIASGVALIALGWAAWHAYQKGTLARNIEVESTRLKSALTTIVPAVDSAIESLDDATKTVVKNALSRAMDADHKKLVKEIRAAI
jgi:hypothetical protein